MLLFVHNLVIADALPEKNAFFFSYPVLPIDEEKSLMTIKNPSSAQSGIYIFNGLSEDWLKKNIQPLFVIQAAGGIIFNDKKEILMIFRRGKWDLPKGKADSEESALDNALRECREECGLEILNHTSLSDITYHMYPYLNGMALKKTHWFRMFAPSGQMLKPQLEEDITDIRWIDIPSLQSILSNSYPLVEYLLKKEMAPE